MKPETGITPLAADITIGATATSLIFGIAASVPLVGIAAAVLVPMPVMYYRNKRGRIAALAIAAGTVLMLQTIMVMPVGDLLFLMGLLTIGVALGEWIDRPTSLERLVGTVCIAVAAIVTIAIGVSGALTGQGAIALVGGYVDQSFDLWVNWYTQNGATDVELDQLRQTLDRLGQILTGLMPAMILSTTLVITSVNVLMARAFYRWRRLPFPAIGPLKNWSAPEPLVWIAITSGLMILLPVGSVLMVIGSNIALVVATIYLFHGIAIIHFYMDKKQIPRALRVLTYSLLVFQTLLAIAVAGLGLFDLWLDLRKLKTNGSG